MDNQPTATQAVIEQDAAVQQATSQPTPPTQTSAPAGQTPVGGAPVNTKRVLIMMGAALFLLGLIIGYYLGGLQTRGTQLANKTAAVSPTPAPSSMPKSTFRTPTNYPDSATISITPNSGPPGTMVHVTIAGLSDMPLVGASAVFIDRNGNEGMLERDPMLNKNLAPPEQPKNGTGEFYARIPDSVYKSTVADSTASGELEDITSSGDGSIRYYSVGPDHKDGRFRHVDATFIVTER